MPLLPFAGRLRPRPIAQTSAPVPYARPNADWGFALFHPASRPAMPTVDPWPTDMPLPPLQQWLPDMQPGESIPMPLGYPEEGLATLLARYALAREAGYGAIAADDNGSLHDAASWIAALPGEQAIGDPLTRIRDLIRRLPEKDRYSIRVGNARDTYDWAPPPPWGAL